MRRSLFPSDESLPTWLHTTLIVAIGLPISAYLFWLGIEALLLGQLEPVSGPDFGQYFFGNVTLHGRHARIAGVSLILDGAAFMAFVLRFSRFKFAPTLTGVAVSLFVLATVLSFVATR